MKDVESIILRYENQIEELFKTQYLIQEIEEEN